MITLNIMKSFRNIVLASLMLMMGFAIQAQTNSTSNDGQTNALPDVFQIGEFDEKFGPLERDHDMLLLAACNDDMDKAFQKWMNMIYDIEQHAKKVGYDINGIKMWLYVFWDKGGKINHIAYHLKPNSRKADTDELSGFLDGFVDAYAFDLKASANFSHYGSASFPTLFEHIRTN